MDRLHRVSLRSLRRLSASAAALLLAVPLAASAGVLYEDPGWDYLYDGDADARGASSQEAIDGTWRRDESTSWRQAPGTDPNVGTEPGDLFEIPTNPPGGVVALLEGETTYLRVQDTGQPIDWGYVDQSNRRFWFGRGIEREHPGATSVMTNGISITFRARLSSTGPLDPIHPQTSFDIDPEQPQLTEITPWFPKGYNVTDDGQGMFTVEEDGDQEIVPDVGHAVGFALALDLDTPAGVPGGLVMNAKPGVILPGSDHVGLANSNFVAIDDADLVNWHEFWITIVGATTPRTYNVDVYMDGSAVPESFLVRNSNGGQYTGQHIAMGLSATSGFGAVDIDFFAYKLGVVVPVPEPSAAAAALAAFGTLAAKRRRQRRPHQAKPKSPFPA